MPENWLTIVMSLVVLASLAQGDKETPEAMGKTAYLFSSFRGNGQDGLHLAYSHDGLKWTALKSDKAFLKPKVGGKLMRDPKGTRHGTALAVSNDVLEKLLKQK